MKDEILHKFRNAIGPQYVLTGDDTAKWQSDWTGGYRSKPIAVLRPANTSETSAIVKIAAQHKTPIIPVSGNTGLNGGASGDHLMLSLDRLNRIEAIDPQGRTATVGAGTILSQLQDAADAQDLIFPLTFGARGSAMIGGALSTNAGGSNVLRYGNTRDLVLGVEAVMADGEVLDLMGALHKDNSGYNLKHLLIGAEGTLGIITRAVLQLSPKPKAYATAMVGMDNLPDALDLLNALQAATNNAVEAFEYMPAAYIDGHLRVIENAKAPFDDKHPVNILIEIGATSEADAKARPDGTIPVSETLENTLATYLKSGTINDAVSARNEAQRAEMWARREAAAEIAFAQKPFVDTDIAVALPDVASFLSEASRRLAKIDPDATDLVVAHLGDGNIHYTAYPFRDDTALKLEIREMVEVLVREYSGSFSAEHGVGISKLGSMTRHKDPTALAAMRAIKKALDPDNILNPGKTIPPQAP